MSGLLRKISGTVLLVALTVTHAQANVGQTYGFGSRSGALGGAGVANVSDGYAAYNNPAGVSFDGDQRLILETGLIWMVPKFLPINDVIVENEIVSDQVTYSDVDNEYRSTLGQKFGLVYRVFPQTFNLSFGITAFLPLEQAAYMDTGESFVPEYVLYRSRTQRPQLEGAIGADLGKGFKVGVGFHLAYALTSTANAFLQMDPAKPSTMRFASSLKPKMSPQMGLLFSPSGDPQGFSVGAVLRFPVSSPNNLFLRSGARALGTLAALDFNFSAISTLFYDPLSVEIGAVVPETSFTRTVLQLDYQRWSAFEAPALAIVDPKNENCTGTSFCGINISGGKNPVFDYQDMFVPRLGQELSWGSTTFRLGWAYQPSIFKSLPTGAGNYLDPPKHIFTAGVGLQFKHFLHFEVPCKVDFNVAWHQFSHEHVDKTPGDENGNGSGLTKIGAPGYDSGGKIYGGGVDLTLAF